MCITERCPPPDGCVDECAPLDGAPIDEQGWAHYHAGEVTQARVCVAEFWVRLRNGFPYSKEQFRSMERLDERLRIEATR